MAKVKTIDLSGQLFTENNVPNKPPLPSRPSSGKFHCRGSGKLFPSTCQNKFLSGEQATFESINNKNTVNLNGSNLSQGSQNSLALVIHPDFKPDCEDNHTSTPKQLPNYCRRTQSAKARSRSKPESNINSKSLRQRPQSAGNRLSRANSNSDKPVAVIDLSNKVIPDLFKIERDKLLALPDPRDYNQNVYNDMPPMYFSRPSSAKYGSESSEPCFCKTDKISKKTKALQPSIYGLQRQRQFFGSAPDLTSANCNFEQFPYKISSGIEKGEDKHRNIENQRSTPATLDPLLPWIQCDVPEEVLGVNPKDCLVFLAPVDWSELPEVPDLLDPEDDLPYVEDVTTPKPWNPKKYPHYYSKPVEDWVCRHGAPTPGPGDPTDMHTIYRQTFKLPRMRTADVVRKEIRDLENLLKGVGNQDSTCSMVQYQSEITNFKDTLQETLEMVPERLKNPPKPPDTFGLNKMCADHDDIIARIAERVQECRTELADLELEAGIETARRHFQRANSII